MWVWGKDIPYDLALKDKKKSDGRGPFVAPMSGGSWHVY